MLSVIVRHSGQRAAVEATINSMQEAWAGPTEFIYAGIGGSVSRDLEASSVRGPRESDWQLAALQAATGDYVVFLSADDGVTHQGLDKALSALHAQPSCAFAYGSVRPRELPIVTGRAPRASRVDRFAYLHLLASDFLRHQCAIVYRRSQVLRVVEGGRGFRSVAQVHLELARQFDILAVDDLLAICQSNSYGAEPTRLEALIAEKKWTSHSSTSERSRLEGCDAEVRSSVIAAAKRLRGRASDSSSAGRFPLVLNAIGAVLRHPRGLRAVVTKDVVPWVWRRSPLLRRLISDADAPYRSALQATEHAAVALETAAAAGASVLALGSARPSGTVRAARLRWSYGDLAAIIDGTSGGKGWDYIVVTAEEDWWLGARHPDLIGPVVADHRLVWSDTRSRVFERLSLAGGKRTLVTGYFSFKAGHATAGDLDAQRLVTDWLQAAGRLVDVATAAPFVGGVDWRAVDPQNYDCVIFVCGPFRREPELLELLERFRGATRIGLNLTLLSEFVAGDAFDVMLERDSRHRSRPDMAFGAQVDKVPVVGVCLREHASGTHAANAAIAALLSTRQLATVSIDTRLDDLMHGGNASGLRSAAEIETLISRMDVVVTTRLHGLVLALKHGIPAVAVDPGNEGYKICRQAEAVGWPAAFALHEATEATLADALEYCLSEEGRLEASKCAVRGLEGVERLRGEFLKVLPPMREG